MHGCYPPSCGIEWVLHGIAWYCMAVVVSLTNGIAWVLHGIAWRWLYPIQMCQISTPFVQIAAHQLNGTVGFPLTFRCWKNDLFCTKPTTNKSE